MSKLPDVFHQPNPREKWFSFDGVLSPGYRTASGLNGDPHFPGGTLAMQTPFFLARGLDIRNYHRGTLNVSISPLSYRIVKPRITLRNVQWHPVDRAEDFSFIDVRLLRDGKIYEGLIYYPHPETKPKHFQKPDILEMLFPKIDSVAYGDVLSLQTPVSQIEIYS